MNKSDSQSYSLPPTPLIGSEWACTICTYLNQNNCTNCELCLTPRAIPKPSKSKSKLKPTNLTLSPLSIPSSPSSSSSSKRSRSVPKLGKNKPLSTAKSTKRTRVNRSKSKPNSKSRHISNMFFTSKKVKSPNTPLNELFEVAAARPHKSRNGKKTSPFFNTTKSTKSASKPPKPLKKRKGKSRRTKSILITGKQSKHNKRRNLSNSFFPSYKHKNQLKLTKSKRHKQQLSISKPWQSPPVSISLPTDNSLMKQSITSPLISSPLPANYKQTGDPFLAPPSRRITLYKLPAEKHKILSSLTQHNKSRSGNTTSSPTNFSFASQVYAELQQRLKRPRVSLQIYEESVQKHESILLEILKCTDDRNGDVIDTIINARCDVLCHFLPLIAFTVCQCDALEWRRKLLHKLRDRIVGQSDLRQAVRFFISAYSDIMCVKSVFAALCGDGDVDVTDDSKADNGDSPKDAVAFWYDIASRKQLRDNDCFVIGLNTILRDPVKQLSSPLRRIFVKKIINSNSKPLLIDCYATDKGNVEFLSSTCILKYGDDLRKDKSCMLVLKWINHLFCNIKQLNGVKCLTYNVIPMGKLFGCIELIPDCIPLRDVLSLKERLKLKEQRCTNLISTAAGSYIASYIMGVRDRHFDNILIRTTDCTLFHIDMNYVLGDTVTGLDANKFGITKKFHDLVGKHNYKTFVDLSCNAFLELRRHCPELINFVCLAFSYIYDYQKIRRYIFKQLRMNESDKKSINWLKIQLKNAPFDKQTQLKNTIHKFATR